MLQCLVEGLHVAQELLVVAAEHLGVVLDRLGEHGEWPRVKLLPLPLRRLCRGHRTLGLVEEAHVGGSGGGRALKSLLSPLRCFILFSLFTACFSEF